MSWVNPLAFALPWREISKFRRHRSGIRGRWPRSPRPNVEAPADWRPPGRPCGEGQATEISETLLVAYQCQAALSQDICVVVRGLGRRGI
jgi:hypothetical protein